MNFVDELRWRGMVHTMMPGTEELLEKEMVTAYLGIDPTADSLHIGHLCGVMMLRHFQRCGHKPLALVGGATGMIGDPSGKSQERNLLDEETLRHNQECIKKQLGKFLDFESDGAKLCLEAGALDVLISDTEEREESIWKARGAFLEAIKGSTTDMDEVDMVVPRNKVNEMVEYLHNLHNEVDIRIKSFGHAGDGNLHSYILKDDLSQEEFEKRMAAAMEKIYEKAAQLGGKVSGEHGIGFAKKPYLRESLDPETIELMSGIKKAFDPKNILNPHKVFQS